MARTEKMPYPHRKRTWLRVRQCWELYLFLLPAIALIFIFNYVPMYGIQIAFKNYKPVLGVWGSPWVGLKHFTRMFALPKFKTIVGNTFIISFMSIVLGFPFPIFLSLILNQLRNEKYKRLIQTVTYMPHFISTVVIVSMLTVFLSTKYGIYRYFCDVLGAEPVNLVAVCVFRHLAAHRVEHDHLSGGPEQHRRGAVRSGDDRRRQPLAAHGAHRYPLDRPHDDHPDHPGQRQRPVRGL